MDYNKALEVSEIIERISANNADIELLHEAVKDCKDCNVGAQLTIKNSKGTYSLIFKNKRLYTLMKVLIQDNEELLDKLKEY